MPILPLDHPEPFAATLGVMLYPALDEIDPPKARAFAAHYLAEPLKRFDIAGHTLSYDALKRIATDAGEKLDDLEGRWQGGLATGDLFKALYALADHKPELASWEKTIKIYESCSARSRRSGSRTNLWQVRSQFLTVAHFWAAWSLRGGKFETHLDVGYDGYAEFQSFLTEAEILRDFGQMWRAPRNKSEPPLPKDVWQVPEDWEPPERHPGWPMTGGIHRLTLPDDLIGNLRPAGRPRKAH